MAELRASERKEEGVEVRGGKDGPASAGRGQGEIGRFRHTSPEGVAALLFGFGPHLKNLFGDATRDGNGAWEERNEEGKPFAED